MCARCNKLSFFQYTQYTFNFYSYRVYGFNRVFFVFSISFLHNTYILSPWPLWKPFYYSVWLKLKQSIFTHLIINFSKISVRKTRWMRDFINNLTSQNRCIFKRPLHMHACIVTILVADGNLWVIWLGVYYMISWVCEIIWFLSCRVNAF